MTQTEHTQAFDKALLSYAEMCYSVALVLTGDPYRAQALARHTLTAAWYLREDEGAEKALKTTLLKALREWYLECYCESLQTSRSAAALAERI